ncbi:MAG: efflux RND transporter permease subunit [Kiritimatiellae bacterium]|nr:efflux RND transporter permease subunit [Kiritimatiellia bacterium]
MKNDLGKERGAIAWMTEHKVAANLLMVCFLAGGLIALQSITQEVFPDVEAESVTVTVSYPGASPEEVEQGAILAIEEGLSGLAGIEEMNSTAAEGLATVRVELIEGADPMQVYQDIRNEVDRIRTFPEDAERPEVRLDVRRRGVMSVVLYGRTSDVTLKELAERARDEFLEDPNITQVDIEGTRDPEVVIEVAQENLRRYGLTLQDVADRIRLAAIELPGGGIETASGEILVRVTERRNYGLEFGRLPIIAGADGSHVLLEDIATVSDALGDVDRFGTYNGMPAVLLEIYRVGGQTPMDVAAAVAKQMKRVASELPEGVQIAIQRDMADVYTQRAKLLVRNGILGLVLVLILLGAFLELRLAFWVMMGIPVSFLGSLLLMPAAGLSLNMITLFAFILTLGIVVDDAIIVGENVYRHHQDGLPFAQAAIAGTREVVSPVAFSILTNMVAFLPLLVLPGMMGRVFGMLPTVVLCVFSISWIEAVFILPSHLAHQRERRRLGLAAWLHERQRRFSDAFLRWVRESYAPFLGRCLAHRYLVVAAALAVLAVTIGYMASGRLGFEMFPLVESDFAYATAALSYGAPIEHTAQVADRMVAAARRVADDTGRPELVKGIFATVGRSGTHDLDVRVYLADPEIRNRIMGTAEFVNRWRAAVGSVKGADTIRFESDRGGPGSGAALTIELAHSRVATLEQAASDLAFELEAFPLATDIDDGFQLGKEQLSFRVRPEGQSLGLTAREIARQVRNAYEGAEVLRQQRGRNELKVKVRLPKEERVSEGTLEAMILRTPGGGEVPLAEVVDVTRGRAYTSIAHRNGRRTMTVTADVRPRAAAGQVMAQLDAQVLPRLMRRYPGLAYSYQGHQAESRKSMTSLWTTLPLVLIAIYAMLAIPFRSYVQPLIVMMSIPFGIVGAVIGHVIMGYSLSMVGLVGIVALSGVVVNDSLVLVDFVNTHRRQTDDVKQAVVQAGVQRFRPILLTTLTTFGGLAPMIFETSRQARFLIPMAISLGYGLLFATMITLVLVPSLYVIIEDVRVRAWRAGRQPPE